VYRIPIGALLASFSMGTDRFFYLLVIGAGALVIVLTAALVFNVF
jgi:hypothetical protein